MEELTTLFIHTPWRQSHKWEINQEGLIEYSEGEFIGLLEVYQRFLVDYPSFTVLRAEVYKRISTPEGSDKPYRWVQLQRFDK